MNARWMFALLCTIALLCACNRATQTGADEAPRTSSGAAETAATLAVRPIEQVAFEPEAEGLHAVLFTEQSFAAKAQWRRVMGPAPKKPDFATEYIVGVSAPEMPGSSTFELKEATRTDGVATLRFEHEIVEGASYSILPTRIYALERSPELRELVVEVNGQPIATLDLTQVPASPPAPSASGALPDTVRRIDQVQYRPETEDLHVTLFTAQNFDAQTFATRIMDTAPQTPDFDTEYVVGLAAPEAPADTRFEATGLTIDGNTATLKVTLEVDGGGGSTIRPNLIYAIRKIEGLERIVVEVDGQTVATLTP